MTNNEIITRAAQAAGLADTILHTFAEWKRLGYSVNKGEHAAMSCIIWRAKTGKPLQQADAQQLQELAPDADGEVISGYYKHLAHFFAASQVRRTDAAEQPDARDEQPAKAAPAAHEEARALAAMVQPSTASAPEQLSFFAPAEQPAAAAPAATKEEQPAAPKEERPTYTIDEAAAKRSNDYRSFSDYKPGSASADYAAQCARAAEIAQRQKAKFPAMADRIDRLLDRYCRRLAEWTNKENRIGCMCPSVMIAGPAGMIPAKKQKQLAAYDKNQKAFKALEAILHQLETAGSGGIQSGEADAVERLQKKLDALEAERERMKAVNQFFRKHGTLDGCPSLSDVEREKLASDMAAGWHLGKDPYASFTLSNMGAEIRRLKDRVSALSKAEAAGLKEEQREGVKIVEDPETMRIKLIFDDKPDEQTREALKSNGFRWAPSAGAWQRVLNANGRFAAGRVLAALA